MNEAVEMHGLSGNESTPAYQQINLRVTVSKNDCDMVDLVFHLLECLKQMEEKMSIVSMQADTELHHMNQFNQAIFRLRIKVCVVFNLDILETFISREMETRDNVVWMNI